MVVVSAACRVPPWRWTACLALTGTLVSWRFRFRLRSNLVLWPQGAVRTHGSG